MAAVQLMCARLGLVTGRGLAGVVRLYYPRWVLWGACALLIVANVFNIGADLGGMAEATEMMTGIKSYYWTPVFTGLIISLLFFSSYRHIARIFTWLTLVLFAYVITAFLAQPDWYAVLKATFVPRVVWSNAFLATFVAILGTTISPYLFFWQASQEVEDERAQGRSTVEEREGATDEELRAARTDVFTGMFFANTVMYFIILTTAATLHASGQTNIETYARRYTEAVVQLKRIVAMDENNRVANIWLIAALEMQGNQSEAFEYQMKLLALQKADEETIQLYKTIYQTSGWQGVLRERVKRFDKGDLAYFYGAAYNAPIGNKEKAFEYLEKSYQRRELWMANLQVDPRLDSLRDDPRFDEMAKRFGLPQ